MANSANSALIPSPAEVPAIRPGFDSSQGYALLDRMATIFSASHLVPILYRSNKANCMIACHMASRVGVDPLTVMQNLYLVNGKPAWSSQFLMAMWNSCGQFSPIRYEWSEDRKSCRAVSTELKTGEKITGATITMAMAKSEGWIDKPGSKWKTMPEQMLMYRAAAFLVRAFAAELSLGLGTAEEVEDVTGKKADLYPALPPVEAPTVESLGGGMASVASVAAEEDVIEVVAEPVAAASVAAVAVAEPAAAAVPIAAAAAVAAPTTTAPAEAKPSAPVSESTVLSTSAQTPAMSGEAPVSPETLAYLADLVKELAPPKEIWKASLAKKFGVDSARLLTEEQAQSLVTWARQKVEAKRLTEWGTGATLKKGEAVAETAPFPTAS